MHKLKQALTTLRNYLGRDQDGLKHLAAVERQANDLRVALAAEKEKSAEAERLRDVALADRQEAERRLAELQATMDRDDQRYRQLEAQVVLSREATEQATRRIEAVTQCPGTALSDPAAAEQLLKLLKRSWPQECPPCSSWLNRESMRSSALQLPVFELRDLVGEELDVQGLLRLGIFVSYTSLVGLTSVVGHEVFAPKRRATRIEQWRQLGDWFKDNVLFADEASESPDDRDHTRRAVWSMIREAFGDGCETVERPQRGDLFAVNVKEPADADIG